MIHVIQGSHQFQSVVNLAASATVDVAGDSSLEFNNRLFLNGNTLTKVGEVTMAIDNNVLTGGGTIDCVQGTCCGTGTVGADLTNTGGTISPGNSPGILTVNGNFNNRNGGTIAMEIEGTDGAGKPQGHDQIQVTRSSTLDGTLRITTGA